MRAIGHFLLFLSLLMAGPRLFAQYTFTGQLKDSTAGTPVYLSWIRDYRKISGVYPDQVIQVTTADSLGAFRFNGDELEPTHQIYRIHTDGCDAGTNHYLRQCEEGEQVSFIASNRDTIHFPLSGDQQIFCNIISTNPSTIALLEIDQMRADLEFDMVTYPSQQAVAMQAKSWFRDLQELGKSFNDPLAEIYVYDLISERRSSLYPYYLEDLASNSYYDGLRERMNASYGGSTYTSLFETDLESDRTMAGEDPSKWYEYALVALLLVSVLVNFYFLYWKPYQKRQRKSAAAETLTPQEEKILAGIRARKSNKELAQELYISLSTVKTHINSIYKKMGVSQREQLY